MSWRSSVLIVILVFGILFSLLYFTNVGREDLPIIIKPKITQEQTFEIVQKDLGAHGLQGIHEVVAYRDDNFENRTYVLYSEFNSSKEYLLPLVLPHMIGKNVSVTVIRINAGGGSNSVESNASCSGSNDAFVCIASCLAKDRLFWIVDTDVDYYAIDAMTGDILYSGSLREQLIKSDPSCFF